MAGSVARYRPLGAEEFALLDAEFPHWEDRRMSPAQLLILATLLRHPRGLLTPELVRKIEAERYGGTTHATREILRRLQRRAGDMFVIEQESRGSRHSRYTARPRTVGGEHAQ